MHASRVSTSTRHAAPSLFADEDAAACVVARPEVQQTPQLPAASEISESELLDRVAALESHVAALAVLVSRVHDLITAKVVVKEFYTTVEAAHILGKRPYTVREWCRLGRVHAVKTHSGRGEGEEWRISHEELTRIQNEGLLPLSEH